MHAGGNAGMIYRSNLVAPDLQPAFKHVHCRPMGHSMGHDVLSDFADRAVDDPIFGLFKACGWWTQDEAAILYTIASQLQGDWLDIGAHTGWTGAHEAVAGCGVTAVDPMFAVPEFLDRFRENVGDDLRAFIGTSNQFFKYCAKEWRRASFKGIVIDGDHCSPCPYEDAVNAARFLRETGVVLFHDFIGRPVREGVEYLRDQGFKCRVYWTPHMVACCWRGDFHPPDHVRDPAIDWETVRNSMPDFDFSGCL